MNTHTNLGRRLVAALGAAALGLVGVVGVANAAPIDTAPTDPKAPKTGSLTIHKTDGDETGFLNNGTEQTVADNPLDGVTFTVTRVVEKSGTAIDLSTAAGWQLIQGVDGDIDNIIASSGYTLGTGTSKETGAGAEPDGQATFGGLPVGLYLVQETDHGDLPIVSTTAPFLVTIPLSVNEANGDATGQWLYDVHAYPKNTLSETPTKVVSVPDTVLNGTVGWTVTQPIPSLNSSDAFTTFVITDELDSRLSYVEGSAALVVSGVTFSSDDYTIDPPTTDNDNTLTLTFNSGGLAKLTTAAQADGDESVVLTFETKVTGSGPIANVAVTNINGNQNEAEATTNWGGITINKTDSATAATLDGATFALYASDPSAVPGADAIETGTTANGGQLSFGNLFLGNGTDTSQDYWVVETSAPKGYVLDSTPKKITVTVSSNGAYFVQSVTNVAAEVPTLPLTGANGQLLALLGGGALVLLAGGTALVARKRSHQNQD